MEIEIAFLFTSAPTDLPHTRTIPYLIYIYRIPLPSYIFIHIIYITVSVQDLSHLPPVLDAIAVTGPSIFRGQYCRD